VHQAFAWLHLHEARMRRWQIEFLGIPAPPFGEAERAAWFCERFREMGLADARVDAAGNAVAELGFGVEGTSSGVAGYGVYGANTGGNVGVYGHSSQGYGFATDSHVSQGRSMGGWVKAMVYINDNASGGVAIARCFNSQIAGSSASTVPCGMSLSGISAGYVVDFGFEVDDRLVQVGFTLISEGEYYSLASDGAAISPNQVLVYSATAQGNFFVPFYVFVY